MSEATSFAYRAAQPDGRIIRGSLMATSREAAAESLSARGLWALEIRVGTDQTSLDSRRRRIPITELAIGLRILADLLEAGLPVARTLAAFEELAPAAWRKTLPAIRESVRQGKSLAASLSEAPIALPRDVIGIVQAGESGSGLASAVQRAAELIEDAASARAALRAALAYPAILVVAGTAAVALLVCVVLPRFTLILADVGQSLPVTTRAVLAMTAGLKRAAMPSVVLFSVCALIGRAIVKRPAGCCYWHKLLLRVPVLGTLRRSAASSRACGTLAALLESGVPIAAALAHAAPASGDAALAERLLASREQVLHGERLSRALEIHRATTPTVSRLVRAGEESGRLASMLAHAARLEREQSVARTKALVRLLEPSLILVFGGMVAFVAAAMLQALYSIRPGS